MPIYEYTCTGCGHRLEALQTFSEPAMIECPNCHESTLQKLVSAASFQLKGTGWYATDFRDKGKQSKESTTSSSGSSTTETKTTTTTTTTTETKTDTTTK